MPCNLTPLASSAFLSLDCNDSGASVEVHDHKSLSTVELLIRAYVKLVRLECLPFPASSSLSRGESFNRYDVGPLVHIVFPSMARPFGARPVCREMIPASPFACKYFLTTLGNHNSHSDRNCGSVRSGTCASWYSLHTQIETNTDSVFQISDLQPMAIPSKSVLHEATPLRRGGE
jgi:hypothetical protein